MIDTIRMFSENFSVLPENSLKLVPSKIDTETGECITGSVLWFKKSTPILGEKAFFNSPTWHLTIKDGRVYIVLSIPKAASVMFSNSKSNLNPVDLDTTKQVLMTVQKEILEHGVKVDIWSCKLSRLDLFRNIQTDESPDDYLPVLSASSVKRMKITTLEHGVRWQNTQHALSVYNKTLEANDKSVPENLLRFEYQLRTSDKIKKILGLSEGTVCELMEIWSSLSGIHKDLIQKAIFNLGYDKTSVPKVIILGEWMKEFRKTKKRNWFSQIVQKIGLVGILNKMSMDDVLDLMRENGCHRSSITRWRKEMQGIPRRLYLPGEDNGNVLFLELMEKCLNNTPASNTSEYQNAS